MNSGEIGKRIDELIEKLVKGSASDQRDAADALVEIGAPAVPALVRVWGINNPDAWVQATYALRKISDASTVPELIRAMEEKNDNVAWAAADALEKIGDSSANPALAGLLGNGNQKVREKAADALVTIGPRNPADLRLVANAAREAKKEGKPVDSHWKVYYSWSKKLEKDARAFVGSRKKFPKPKVKKPGRTEGVLRMKRAV